MNREMSRVRLPWTGPSLESGVNVSQRVYGTKADDPREFHRGTQISNLIPSDASKSYHILKLTCLWSSNPIFHPPSLSES
jgi:hypothetical protein